MANIVPIQGLRFHQQDVPFSTVTECSNPAHFLQSWLQQGVVIPEQQPALYFYQQEFDFAGKKYTHNGFIAGVKLDPEQKGVIIPHQEVLPHEKERQLELLHSSGVQFTPAQGLYTDFSMSVDKILTDILATPPDLEVTVGQGHILRLTVVTDKTVIDQVQQAMARQRIFIVAGEDSYHAMLQYAAEQSSAPNLLMALSNIYVPDLLILPVHRLVNIKPFKLKKFIKQLEEELEVTEFTVQPDGSNLEDFLQTINLQGGFKQRLGIDHRRAFGVYAGDGKGYVVTLRDEGAMDRLLPREGYTFALQGLDAFILHHGILKGIMGIGKEDSKVEGDIDYTNDASTALSKVDSGQFNLAFFINPVLRDELIAVAAGGELLPAKSTYFFPEFPAGLVYHRL